MGAVLDVEHRLLGQPDHPPVDALRVPLDERRSPGDLRVGALGEPVVEWEDVVLRSLDQPEPLEFVKALRLLGGQVTSLGPVRTAAVELPDVVVERRQLNGAGLPGSAVLGHRGPAVVVDPSIADHLEVLGGVLLGRVGVMEAVGHRDALVQEPVGRRCSRS
ncbi:hypothetical protein [Nocardioides sp. Iso805N]|uniref:hypothetical protein n=1 Tax=Nocardioides sp. Iso805N TaxID=1283287 RepID=UPI0012F7DCC1|nr:hypothetical protein [Nocardioides sp. Iso805N]